MERRREEPRVRLRQKKLLQRLWQAHDSAIYELEDRHFSPFFLAVLRIVSERLANKPEGPPLEFPALLRRAMGSVGKIQLNEVVGVVNESQQMDEDMHTGEIGRARTENAQELSFRGKRSDHRKGEEEAPAEPWMELRPGVYAFPVLAPEYCRRLARELRAFKRHTPEVSLSFL